MKNQVRKAMAERSIRKLARQLEDLQAQEAASTLDPVPDPEETYLVKSKEKKKERLLEELQRYRAIIADCHAAEKKGKA